MKSLGAQVTQLYGLVGTKDLNSWETEFVESVWTWSREGKNTAAITEKQVVVIERIYRKHFADAEA